MDEIIEIMARADIAYFWREAGKSFEQFEKPVADGVRARMHAIVQALEAEGYSVSPTVEDGWIFR